MNILFINPPFKHGFSRGVRGVGESTRGGSIYCPIWLCYAAANVCKDHKIKIIDSIAAKLTTGDVIKESLRFSPDVIVVDSNFSSYKNDIDFSLELKKYIDKEIKIIMVGPPCNVYGVEMAKSGIDVVIKLEYDLILQEIILKIEKQESLDKIESIIINDHSKIIETKRTKFSSAEELDNIEFVSKIYRNNLDLKNYFLSSSLFPSIQIITGRGCPNNCSFCSWPVNLTARKYRVRSVDNVLDEFEWISREFRSVKEIVIEDDTFTVDKERVVKFCIEYKNRKLKIPWSCNSRADVPLNVLEEMKSAGCRLVITGFESANDSILANIHKGFTKNQYYTYARNVKKSGLLLHADFIIGLPGETQETVIETKKFIKDISPELLQILIPQPIPGTELYDYCIDNDYLSTPKVEEYLDESGYQKSVISYPSLSAEQIQLNANNLLTGYYYKVDYLLPVIRQVFRKNGDLELKRIIKSGLKFNKYSKTSSDK